MKPDHAQDEARTPDTGDEAELKEIRNTFKYYNSAWKDIRDEGDIDMRNLAGDPWDPDDKRDRKENGRPVLALDELNQYVNQLINDVRLNKRGIVVKPKGAGASDKSAELRQGIIRNIEYESNANIAYTTAFEGAASRGYGYARITSEYESGKSFNQVLRIVPIPNPDSVLYDPDAKLGPLDAEGVFILDYMKLSKFGREYPDAEKKSFDADDIAVAPEWIKGDSIVVAEFQKVTRKKRTLIQRNEMGETAYLDEYEGAKLEDGASGEELVLADGSRFPILNSRECEERQIVKYITNGVEILKKSKLPGKYVRIIPCYGKETFRKSGSGTKRELWSLVRLARDPYMLYCYLCSQEAEEAAMTPKAPYMGPVGMFKSDKDAWDNLHRIPRPYVQYDVMTDQLPQGAPLAPTRIPFVPNFQAYEFAKESARRAIQSAMGMYNASVGKHDSSVKSGKQQDALDRQSSQGNFHFIDNFDRFMTYVGLVVDDNLPFYYDSTRAVGVRKPDDSHAMVTIHQPKVDDQGQAVMGKDGQPAYENDLAGEHDATISTGPSSDSQREAASDFGDLLVQHVEQLSLPPELKAKLIALTVRMRNLGPFGDQMADILDPQQQGEMPPQALQAMGQMQQQIKMLNEACKEYEAKLQQMTLEKQAKILDNEQKLVVERLKIEAQIAIAEIATKAQKMDERLKFVEDMAQQLHMQAHEAGLQAAEHAHQAAQADAAAANAAVAQAADHQAAAQQQTT